MYVQRDQVPVFEGFGAIGDPAVVAVGSVLRIPAGTLVSVGLWTYTPETDPARLAEGIVGGERWVFHPARVQSDVDMEMDQDVDVAEAEQPGAYQLRWKTWAGKLLTALTAADIDTGAVYTKTAGTEQMVEIPAGQVLVVVEAAPGSTAVAVEPVDPVDPVNPAACPDGQWRAKDGTCVPIVGVTPVAPPSTSVKPWYKRPTTYVAGGLAAVIVVGLLIALRRRG